MLPRATTTERLTIGVTHLAPGPGHRTDGAAMPAAGTTGTGLGGRQVAIGTGTGPITASVVPWVDATAGRPTVDTSRRRSGWSMTVLYGLTPLKVSPRQLSFLELDI